MFKSILNLRMATAITDPRDLPAYNLGEAARYLGVSVSTLRSWFAGQQYDYQGETREFLPVIKPATSGPIGLSFSNLVEA